MPGASRTKQILAASLKDLMQTMPLEKISVSDIVEHADIGRNTFYYHFQDKFDLVNWIFQTESTRFFTERAIKENWSSALESIEDYLKENKEFYCNALAYNGQNSLQSFLFDTISDLVVQQVRSMEMPEYRSLSKEELRFIGDFIASAMVGIVVRWAKLGMKEDPRQFRACVRRICDGSLIHAYLSQPEDDAAENPAPQET
ncbi:MAG: dihydroxyacetone kinase transcriptional activator DhaS [Faecalibacterium sp.]|jgi:probable dihydroxyacetone kinase regulator|nr:dihydroxyacetone kinase transcriptional activator DhaS [Faecalibacterium sp.]